MDLQSNLMDVRIEALHPFVGQPALYYPSADDPIYRDGATPLAAIVCHVWSPRCVNLAVFDRSGMPQSKTSVPFASESADKPVGSYAVPTVEVIPGVLMTSDGPVADEAPATPRPGAVAARVRSEEIDGLMSTVVVHTHHFPGTTCTVAIAALPDGFVLATGKSACISPALFDAEIGVKVATADALKKARETAWELEGYLLRDRLQADA